MATTKTASELMRDSASANDLSWNQIRSRAKELAVEEIDRDMDRFASGGRGSIMIFAAIVTLTVEKKGATNG